MLSVAWAQSGGGAGPSLLELVFPLLLVFGIIYFLIIRPQQKRQREHAALIAGLKQKDKVVTQGGLIGEIRHVGEQDVTVRISDGVDVRIVKTMIASVQGR